MNTGKVLKACRRRRKWAMRDVADASAQSVQDDWVVANAERGENCMMKTFETLVTAMGYRIMLRDVFEEASTGKPCIYDISEFEQ